MEFKKGLVKKLRSRLEVLFKVANYFYQKLLSSIIISNDRKNKIKNFFLKKKDQEEGHSANFNHR